jgi:hypothetical protein
MGNAVNKERSIKEDGRYIIFYDFDNEGEESGEKEES